MNPTTMPRRSAADRPRFERRHPLSRSRVYRPGCQPKLSYTHQVCTRTCIFYSSAVLTCKFQKRPTVTSMTMAPFLRCSSLTHNVFRSRDSVASARVKWYPFELIPGASCAMNCLTGSGMAANRALLILATSTLEGYLPINFWGSEQVQKLTVRQAR